ncbi:hypothetical protein L1987_18851 [Smallanthus sonchifolius]|uniref:Uncharacterized protein n=1 Tax=Smallanthus sonchifolius TaxID=185202 RepID=A0ACB9J2X9_9ASTR|nr:hypothetical protein L1987_18851 [Smallanthus sonchifolius]
MFWKFQFPQFLPTKDPKCWHVEDSNEASFFMLSTMCDELRRELEYHPAYDMACELKKRIHQNRSEHVNVLKSLSSSMEIRTGMSSHFSKMGKLINSLQNLGSTISQYIAIDFILMSLPAEYEEFVNYYKKYVVGETLSDLRGSLMAFEMTLGQMDTLITKPRKRGKKRVVFKSDDTCHYCGEIGHWKNTCPSYLAKKTKASEAGSSGMFVIEIFSLSRKSWVFDTGCGYHICNDLQGQKKVRRLKQGDLELHVGNGQKIVVKAVGEHTLLLPSGLELVLNKPHNEIYEIEVHDNNVLFNISSKHTKYDLNDTYLWHCRLGYINKNRMKKLQTAGILNSTGQESFDDYQSCLSGKLTKVPFSCIGQMAKDLLGLIHTDVCGPFRTMSRSGERYFVTFTDDLSRYGYLDKTPYEIWHGEKPKVSYLRVWGCNTYVTSESTDMLNPHGDKVVFVRYPKTISYYFYNPAENRVFVKHGATFLKKELLARGIGDNRVDMDEIQEP